MQNLKRNWLVVSKLTWGIWLILPRALENLKNFQFNALLLSKVFIVWGKKVQSSYLSWHWRMIQNLVRNQLSFQNYHEEFDKFWPEHSYILFELKKYRGVIFHGTEEWCKIRRKTDLWFEKWHEKFGKFSPERLKVSKLVPWWDP